MLEIPKWGGGRGMMWSQKQSFSRTVPPLLLRIHSAHFGMVGQTLIFLNYGQPTKSKSVFARFITMLEKKILSKPIEIQNDNIGGTTHFSEITTL